MKLLNLSSLLIVLTVLIISGCAIKPKPGQEVVIDSSLPKITLTKSATKSTMTSIAIEWAKIKNRRVKGIYIYRESLDEAKTTDDDAYYATIDNRYATHFLDENVKPNHRYNYYFVTYSADAQGERSDIYPAATKPVLNSVSWIYAASGMPRSAKVIWRPHTNEIVKAYDIQRKTFNDTEWKTVARVEGRLSAEYIDFGLSDSVTYQYNVRAVTYNSIISKPSDIVKSITKELPREVTNLAATNNLPKKIIITWDESKNEDFSHYNLYRSNKIDGGYTLLSKLKKSKYQDEIPEDGDKYFYRVSAVDKDGLESIHDRSSASGMSLSKPLPPSVVEARLIDNKQVVLEWKKNDVKATSYSVRKRYSKGLFDTAIDEFKEIKGTKFEDSKIEPAQTYYYQVLSVDKYSIESKPSMEVVIETKEIKKEEVQK